jgi:hypothetical protein
MSRPVSPISMEIDTAIRIVSPTSAVIKAAILVYDNDHDNDCWCRKTYLVCNMMSFSDYMFDSMFRPPDEYKYGCGYRYGAKYYNNPTLRLMEYGGLEIDEQ